MTARACSSVRGVFSIRRRTIVRRSVQGSRARCSESAACDRTDQSPNAALTASASTPLTRAASARRWLVDERGARDRVAERTVPLDDELFGEPLPLRPGIAGSPLGTRTTSEPTHRATVGGRASTRTPRTDAPLHALNSATGPFREAWQRLNDPELRCRHAHPDRPALEAELLVLGDVQRSRRPVGVMTRDVLVSDTDASSTGPDRDAVPRSTGTRSSPADLRSRAQRLLPAPDSSSNEPARDVRRIWRNGVLNAASAGACDPRHLLDDELPTEEPHDAYFREPGRRRRRSRRPPSAPSPTRPDPSTTRRQIYSVLGSLTSAARVDESVAAPDRRRFMTVARERASGCPRRSAQGPVSFVPGVVGPASSRRDGPPGRRGRRERTRGRGHARLPSRVPRALPVNDARR